MFFPFNGTLASRFFWLAMAIVGVFVSCGYAWNRYRPEFLNQPQYQITSESMRVTQLPEYLQVDVNAEVLPEIEQSGTTLLDRDALTSVAQAFLKHRCVAGVYSVSKSANQIQCELEYHRPVAAIEVADSRNRRSIVPITSSSVVMEPGDLKTDVLDRLIRIDLPGLTRNEMEAGAPIDNASLLRSAQIAGELAKHDGLDSVVRIQQQNELSESLLMIQLKNGTRVIWGSANEEVGEVAVGKKIAALKEVIARYADSQSETDFRDLDIRNGKPRRVIPKTASMPQ